MKSGWCIDEVQANDFGSTESAKMLHDKCKIENCECSGHDSDEDEE